MKIWRIVTLAVILVWSLWGLYLTVSRQFGRAELAARSAARKSSAPDFELKDIDGVSVRLSDFKDRRIILNFWATWCPPRVEEMPSYQKLSVDHPEIVILAVSVDEDKQAARKFVAENHITFRVLLDDWTGGSVAKRLYGVDGIPESLFIYPDHKIAKKIFGGPVNWQGNGPDPDDKAMLDKFLRGEL